MVSYFNPEFGSYSGLVTYSDNLTLVLLSYYLFSFVRARLIHLA